MVVRRFADSGTRMFLLHKRLKHIKLRLKEWNKNEFGNIFEGKKNQLKTKCRNSTKPPYQGWL
jgi:hypothetical protein